MLSSIQQRNCYLENKIDKLKNQFYKQNQTFSQIRSSEKWKNKENHETKHYKDKYI